MSKYTSTFFLYLKARTSLVGIQFPMPHNECVRVVFFQSFNQSPQGFLLLWRAGVCRKSPFIETSLVADADGVLVIARGVCAHLIELSPTMHHPVLRDIVVIADVGKATGTMVTTAVVHGVALRGAGGTTMYHYQVDAAVVLVLAAG